MECRRRLDSANRRGRVNSLRHATDLMSAELLPWHAVEQINGTYRLAEVRLEYTNWVNREGFSRLVCAIYFIEDLLGILGSKRALEGR